MMRRDAPNRHERRRRGIPRPPGFEEAIGLQPMNAWMIPTSERLELPEFNGAGVTCRPWREPEADEDW